MSSFASGINAGVNVASAASQIAERLRSQSGGGGRSGFTTRPSAAIPADTYHSTKDVAKEQATTDAYQKSRLDLIAAQNGLDERIKVAGEEQQAQDFKLAAAAVSVGETSLAQEYVNRYGDPRMTVSVDRGADGKLLVTPHGMGGKKAPMEFRDAREFYTGFFGQLRPKGSDFALPEEKAQEWAAIGNEYTGVKLMDKKSGALKDGMDAVPFGGRAETAGAGGKGPGDSEAAKNAWDRYNWLQRQVANLSANVNKETVIQDPYTGEAIKKTITKGDVEVYEKMAQNELKFLSNLGAISLPPAEAIPTTAQPEGGPMFGPLKDGYRFNAGSLPTAPQTATQSGPPPGYKDTGKTKGGKPVYAKVDPRTPGPQYYFTE